ncbi:MAG TPA: Nif3-like dinuclear metal center hexameric protein [Deinococcales bacterium]|nr:Nif3-like dinuclear metal center hexameric protein [Deinococcales bacterium]
MTANPGPARSRHELVAWLDQYLNVPGTPDKSLNGLQVEGKDEVHRIAVAVDSSLATLEAAARAGADFLIVHHGFFWGEPLAIRGPHKRRVQTLLDAGISLYAAHAPLDIHPEVGNSLELARGLGMGGIEPFGSKKGLAWGVRGALPVPVSLQDLADSVQRVTGEVCLVHSGGGASARSIGIVSGASAGFIADAAAAGLDTFIGGEPSHAHFAEPFELGINVIWAGHYETETLGVRALAVKIEDTFGLPWQFLHLPTGL